MELNYNVIHPRQLHFGPQDEDETSQKKNSDKLSMSPPYRKVRALRLFDTPATPKTIIKKSRRPFADTSVIPDFPRQCLSEINNSNTSENISNRSIDIPRPVFLHNRSQEECAPTANVNPFTPDSLSAHNKKRCRTQFGQENNRKSSLFSPGGDDALSCMLDDNNVEFQAPKRLALQDTNISRYNKEFIEMNLIGAGEFGVVYQCLNRLDGCIYAIKKSIKPVAGSSFEKRALNEVWAHAVLGKHDNVVRYYSAWAEDNHMLIQNEFCNGGSLQSFIQKRFLNESELKILLLHVAEGLRYIHSNDLVHMDLKAGNIFLTIVSPKCPSDDCADDGIEGIYEELEHSECIVTYKIGDLGHVTSIKDANVEEGDCRYLPKEILQENFQDLCKADIFSFGITLYEAAGGGPLPKNGPEWHKLRNGHIPSIPSLSKDFNELIKQMTHPDPAQRPTSTSIFNHSILCALDFKSKSQLIQELHIERRKNELLVKKLKETRKLLRMHEHSASTNNNDLKYLTSSDRCLRSSFRKRRISGANIMDGFNEKSKFIISTTQR